MNARQTIRRFLSRLKSRPQSITQPEITRPARAVNGSSNEIFFTPSEESSQSEPVDEEIPLMQTPSEEELLRTQYVDLNKVQLKFLKYAPPYAIKEAREAMIRVQQLQSQGVLRNGVYYLVLIDLVGSTKFAAAHGNQKAAGRIQLFVKASFNSLNAANLKNVGLFVEEIGDAVLYVFSHFTDILAGYNAFAPSWQFGGRCPGSLF